VCVGGGGGRRNHSAPYQVVDMASQSAADKVEAAVRALPGVLLISIDLVKKMAKVTTQNVH